MRPKRMRPVQRPVHVAGIGVIGEDPSDVETLRILIKRLANNDKLSGTLRINDDEALSQALGSG